MKSSAILLRAAELVDSGKEDFACIAINGAAWQLDSTAKTYFTSMYGPKIPSFCVWFGDCRLPENQQHRVMALLLCAAIAEDSGD